MDLSLFSPVCLPDIGEAFVEQNAFVYGEQRTPPVSPSVSILGWGYSFEGTSPDKLQETIVPIVQTSYCLEGMNQTEGVDEHLIVCTEGGVSGGPCQVVTKLLLYDKESDEGYKSVRMRPPKFWRFIEFFDLRDA